MPSITLNFLPGEYAVCRLGPTESIPSWSQRSVFSAIIRTTDELSILCPAEQVPVEIKQERGWRLIKFEGPFVFTLTGILASVLNPLVEAKISILALSTFDTDYVLVKADQAAQAAEALTSAGHVVRMGDGK